MMCIFIREINVFLLHHADAFPFRSLHTLDPASSSTYFLHKTGRQDEGFWKIYEQDATHGIIQDWDGQEYVHRTPAECGGG